MKEQTYKETDTANDQEKIINRFFRTILEKRKFVQEGESSEAVVAISDVSEAWQQFKKEWYENKNA